MTTTEDRACKACNACCTLMAVDELGKKAGVRCEHLRSSANGFGCAIYDSRPASCAQFRCGWHQGFGSAGERPDKSGIMLTSQEPAPGTRLHEAGHRRVVQVHEVWSGGASTTRAVKVIRRVANEIVTVLIHQNGERRILGPEGALAALKSVLGPAGYREEK